MCTQGQVWGEGRCHTRPAHKWAPKGQACRRLRKAWMGEADGLMGSCLTGGCCARIQCSMEGLEVAVKAQTSGPGLPPARGQDHSPGAGLLGLQELVTPAGGYQNRNHPPPPDPSQCPAGTPLRQVSLRSEQHEATWTLSLPDRQVSPQQHNGPPGGLRLPGECGHPWPSWYC